MSGSFFKVRSDVIDITTDTDLFQFWLIAYLKNWYRGFLYNYKVFYVGNIKIYVLSELKTVVKAKVIILACICLTATLIRNMFFLQKPFFVFDSFYFKLKLIFE